MSLDLFDSLESAVRSYCRSFPALFDRARGAALWDASGREYLDFFSGAGALNYGHNHPSLKAPLLEYLQRDGVLHSLDLATTAKEEFLRSFRDRVLAPRGLEYRLQFPGPTGTNAVEAALKLVRKVTGRTTVLHFMGSFHGMTLGSLAVTGNLAKRGGAGVPLGHAAPLPFDGDLGGEWDGVDLLQALLEDPGSGMEPPAAVILETIQAEGGVKVARPEWLRRLQSLLRRHGVLLIVDDIQVGCGRTGPFFSFEEAGLEPDVVCLSKSLSGIGLPLSLVLLRPELDVWEPGEHNGTFRGNNAAFVTAAASLELWRDDTLTREVERKARRVRRALSELVEAHPESAPEVRGRGLIQGLRMMPAERARQVSAAAFRHGLIVETAGPRDEVVKLLPPLTIDDASLDRGLDLLAQSVRAVAEAAPDRSAAGVG